MQIQIVSLVICAVLSAAVAEVFFEEKFTEGKTFFPNHSMEFMMHRQSFVVLMWQFFV